MKNIWKDGKLTPFARRLLSLALCMCLLASVVQNITLKGISADETVSGSDVAVVTQSDAVSETDEVSCADSSESDVLYSSENTVDYGEPKITMTTALPVGSAMDLSISTDDTVYIDWGDGNILPYSSYSPNLSESIKGNTIKVYCKTGILYFDCNGNKITSIDVSNNPKLGCLKCSDNNLTELNIAENAELLYLYCSNNALTELDVTNQPKLDWFECEGNELSQLDVTNNTVITGLKCGSNQLTSIDVTKCPKLGWLWCEKNKLTEIDLSSNPVLEYYYGVDNNLTTIDVSNNPALVQIHVDRNNISDLKLPSGYALKMICCPDNQLTEIDITKCSGLESIFCSGNKLRNLDVSHNPLLIHLNFGGNLLSEIDISENPLLEQFFCFSNRLTFADIPNLDIDEFLYAWQAEVEIPEKAYEIDLSSEYDIGGTITTYTWYNASDDSIVTPAISANGVFTFGNDLVGEKLYCTMTNDVFPDLTLTTTEVEVVEVLPEFGDPQIIMTTTKEIGSMIYLGIVADDTVYVDCGDGEYVEYVTGEHIITKGNDIKVYCDGDISDFYCIDNELTELDISNSINLKTLECYRNELTELDITKNKKLYSLNCDGNKISELDVSNNNKLEVLFCSSNNLSSIDVSNNLVLWDFGCANNNLTKLDISKNTALRGLYCDNNQLTELDISNNLDLVALGCAHNQLKELDVSRHINLRELHCGYNQISKLHLDNHYQLEEVRCQNNNLIELDLKNSNGIQLLVAHTNYLRFSTMSTNISQMQGIVAWPNPVELPYAPQKNVAISKKFEADAELDLSSEYIISGTDTIYTWYNASDDSIVTPAISANGVFTFGNDLVGEKLYCTMTNDVFPDLTLTTTEVEIIAGNSETESDSDMTPDDTESDTDISPDDTESDTDITPDENKSDSDIDPTPDTEVKGESDSADPDTGDNSNIALVTIICVSSFVLMAACVASGVIVFRKKRKAKNK